MNIPDLSKIDIQDLQKLDYMKLLQELKKRPDVLITVVLVLVTLILSVNIFMKKSQELQSLQQEISKLEAKDKVIAQYDTAKKELTDFLVNIPKTLLENDLINTVTDFAVARSVQIESYTPARKQSLAIYDLTSISLNVTAAEYKNIWLFVNDIEKSKYAIRVENWSGSTDVTTRNTASRKINLSDLNPVQSGVTARLEIAAINLKSEEK